MTATIDLVRDNRLEEEGPDPRRFWALAVIAVAQLMIVLDASGRHDRPSFGAEGPRHLDRKPTVGLHRLHARLRRPVVARRPDRGLPGS